MMITWYWEMLQTNNTKSVSSLTHFCQFLTRNIDLATVDKLYDVGQCFPLQLQTKVLQPQNHRNLNILFTQLFFEELAAGCNEK